MQRRDISLLHWKEGMDLENYLKLRQIILVKSQSDQIHSQIYLLI